MLYIKHRLKQHERKQALYVRNNMNVSKDAFHSKLYLISVLIGFMILLGLPWVILVFTDMLFSNDTIHLR